MLEQAFRVENGRIMCGSDALMAGLAHSMTLTLKRFKEILETSLEIGCFDKNLFDSEKVISSPGVQKRLKKVTDERERERLRKDTFIKLKEEKKYKEKRKTPGGKPPENPKPSSDKKLFLEFVLLSDEEFTKLTEQFGEKGTNDRIFNLNQYGHQKPKKFKEYDSHYHTILAWERKNKQEGKALLKFPGASRGTQAALQMIEDIRKKKAFEKEKENDIQA
jgi:hypothetical protein